MWTLESAQRLVGDVQQASRDYKYHVALGGGVLNVGFSTKDVDLYFLPLDNNADEASASDMLTLLEQMWGPSEPIGKDYATNPAFKLRHKFNVAGKRIDVFIH